MMGWLRISSGKTTTGRVGSLALSVVALATFETPVFAGAWTQEKGHGQIITTGLYASADDAFVDDRNADVPDFAKSTTSIYLDYGLIDGVTVFGDAELGGEQYGNEPMTRPALTRAVLGSRVRLYRSDCFAMSGSLALRVEDTYGDDDLIVDRFGWDSPSLEARWSGGTNLELFGRTGFAEVSAGYRHGFNGAPSEAVFDTTLGLEVVERVTALAQSFSTLSVERGDRSEDYSHHKAQGSAVWDFSEHWSVQGAAPLRRSPDAMPTRRLASFPRSGIASDPAGPIVAVEDLAQVFVNDRYPTPIVSTMSQAIEQHEPPTAIS